MRREKLGQSRGRKRVFGGDIKRWARQAMWCRELGGKKERQEKLSFACAAESLQLSYLIARGLNYFSESNKKKKNRTSPR